MSIVDMTAEQLRQFIQQRHEKEFALIDVRQPGEYQQGHIPGARLLPLPELVRSLGSIPTDKELVFYCRSGGRSLAAGAMIADEQITEKRLYNLQGGIMAWDGGLTADFPQVRLFGGQDAPAMLQAALNLEKGALNYYSRVHRHYEAQSWAQVFADLSQAEIGHAKTVYHFLKQIDPRADTFEDVFERQPGDVLEGGLPLETALQTLSVIKERACLRLIELALQIEYAAYDLYRGMADQSSENVAREAFFTLAQAEKGHMRVLIKAIGDCS